MKAVSLFIVLLVSHFTYSQVNIGFEGTATGTYTSLNGWTSFKGSLSSFIASGICQTLSPAATPPVFKVISTPYTIPSTSDYQEFDLPAVPVSPFGGNKVLELNSNLQVQNVTGSIWTEQSFTVTPANQIFQYAYYVALKSIYHPCCETHYNLIELFDCNGNVIPASTTSMVPLPTTTIAGCFNTATVGMALGSGTTSPQLNTLYTPVWLIKSYNLSSFIGTCVKIKAESGTCNAGGHSGLFYFDASASPSAFLVNNTLATGASYVVCNTSTATLSAIPAASYLWMGPASFSSTAQSFTTSVAGVYSLTLGNPGGAAAFTQTLNLVMANSPSVQISISANTICAGQNATLTALGSGINSNLWSTGSVNSAITVSPSVTTVYGFTANAATCPATITSVLNVVNCLGLADNIVQPRLFNVYPNPCKGQFSIQSFGTQKIVVTDVSGRLIVERELHSEEKIELNLDYLSDGVYFISNQQNTIKLLILH